MRTRYVWHRGEWVDVTNAPRRPRVGPYIIRDTMDAIQHPATGEVFDSKSAFRAVTRQHGLVELGNDAPMSAPAVEPRDVAKDVAEAWSMVEQGAPVAPVETIEGEYRTYQ